MSDMTMAEVLKAHKYNPVEAVCSCSDLVQVGLRCDPQSHEDHVAEMLSAAGFGLAADAGAKAPQLKRVRGELKSLGKHLDSWESQGHTTVTIRFLRFWIRDRAAELSKP